MTTALHQQEGREGGVGTGTGGTPHQQEEPAILIGGAYHHTRTTSMPGIHHIIVPLGEGGDRQELRYVRTPTVWEGRRVYRLVAPPPPPTAGERG